MYIKSLKWQWPGHVVGRMDEIWAIEVVEWYKIKKVTGKHRGK